MTIYIAEARDVLESMRRARADLTNEQSAGRAWELSAAALIELRRMADEFIPGPYVPGQSQTEPLSPITDTITYVNAAVTMLDQDIPRLATEYLDTAINELEHYLTRYSQD